LLDYGRRVYRAPRDLTDHVVARDSVCVFRGCARAAQCCDLDHIEAFDDGGSTAAGNLAPLCRRHHNAKTHGPYRYRRADDGGYHWSDRYGQERVSRPPRRWVVPRPGGLDVEAENDRGAQQQRADDLAALRRDEDERHSAVLALLDTRLHAAADPGQVEHIEHERRRTIEEHRRILQTSPTPRFHHSDRGRRLCWRRPRLDRVE
jgi:hypothetical protein